MGSNPTNLKKKKNHERNNRTMVTYNDLKNIQMNERSLNNLSNIPQDFYEQCADYFYRLEQKPIEELDVRLYQNALACYTEIVERRLNKITTKSYFVAVRLNKINKAPTDKGEDYVPPNIISTELHIFNKVLEEYDIFYNNRYNEYLKVMEEDHGKI